MSLILPSRLRRVRMRDAALRSGRGNGTFRRLPQTLIPPSSDTTETSYGCVYEET